MTARRVLQHTALSLLSMRSRPWTPHYATGRVVVFSPHYDDETLGAGGTIIKLREKGIPVHLVFMTDGSRSHARAMDSRTLAELRRQESLSAAAILGIEPSCVKFLELPETRLFQSRAAAVLRVAALLDELQASCVFIPSRLEPIVWSTDHRETMEIVLEALRRTGGRPEIVEYLVWFWYHWPWVPIFGGKDAGQLLNLTWKNAFGARSCLNINASVRIDDVWPLKKRALEQYRTQMQRLTKDKPWPILADVAHGEFLNCFFRSHEYFRAHRSLSYLKRN